MQGKEKADDKATSQGTEPANDPKDQLIILNAIFGPGHLASEIAKESPLTPEQQFRRVIKPGVLVLVGDGYVCRQLAIPPCKAVSGLNPIMPRKHGKIKRMAIYLCCPEGVSQFSQAIQSQGGISKNSKFFLYDWNPASKEEGTRKLIEALSVDPDLLVMVVDNLKANEARIDFQRSDPDLEMIHKTAMEKDVTVLWLSESTPLPPSAGTIRISQGQGQNHYNVIIDQEGLGVQNLVFEPNHGARLGTYAKNVSEDAVLAFLHSQGGAKVKKATITKHFALSNFDADRILRALIEKGDVTKPEKGYFAAVLKKIEQQ